ncbi:MAG TPA: acylphosphatase [Methylomirabilota bacterium]|jgi:acylphosphatase
MSEADRHAGRRPGGRLGAVEILVGGRVQGVGYRNFAQRRADERRLTGYAVNLPDGRVKIRAEGDLEAIEQFVRDLGAGPPLARVERVDVSSVPFSGRYGEFGIRFSEGR